MAIKPVTAAQLIVDVHDLSPFTGNITETPGARTMRDSTTFSSRGFQCWTPGFRSGMWGLSGFTDHTETTGVADMINPTDLGVAHGVSIAIPSSGFDVAANDWCQFGTGRLAEWNPLDATTDELMAFMGSWSTTEAFATGKVAAPLASRTTSGLTGTACGMVGPSATQRMYALLQVTAAAGTNLAVKVQSDDNSSFTSATDRITFSTVSAVGTQLLSVAGDLSTETYWRVVATIASSTFSFAVSIGVA